MVERVCAKFTGKTYLVPRSDQFECQGQRSRSPGTKNALCTAIAPPQRRNGARWLQITSRTSRRHHSIASGVISAACVRALFGKTSLALVSLLILIALLQISATGIARYPSRPTRLLTVYPGNGSGPGYPFRALISRARSERSKVDSPNMFTLCAAGRCTMTSALTSPRTSRCACFRSST